MSSTFEKNAKSAVLIYNVSKWLLFYLLSNEVIHVETASWAGSQYMWAEYISEFQKYFVFMAFPFC